MTPGIDLHGKAVGAVRREPRRPRRLLRPGGSPGNAQRLRREVGKASGCANLWREASVVAERNGFELPTFEEFRLTGRFACPTGPKTRVQFGDFAADPAASPLRSASGKVELSCDRIWSFGVADCPGHPTWLEPADWLGPAGAAGMLHLVSGPPLTRLHGQLDNGLESRAAKIRDREPVFLNPQTARERGIEAG